MGFSIAAPSYNEGYRLKRFVLSALEIKGVDEIFIVNHRSDDNTLEILNSLVNVTRERNIELKWVNESRDFNKDFNMAHLRNIVVKGCCNEIVHMLDADMVLGKNYSIMVRTCERIFKTDEKVYAIGYEVPCVREYIKSNNNIVTDFGNCIIHPSIPRVFLRDCSTFHQDRGDRKYEWAFPNNPQKGEFKKICRLPNSIISVDIKPERYATNEERDPLGLYFGEIYRDKELENINYLDYIQAYREGKFPQHTKIVSEETKKTDDNPYIKYDIIGEEYFFGELNE